ncbi:MAG: tRNA (N(6)-L-threonylcarbamoyladenosine(37)-C(2))-methylthiotransferase MtaB [Candidatus Margulisiibacteriota bacterium]
MSYKTAAIFTLGCRTNQAESDQIARDLLESGIRLVPFKEKADLYLINTCTVTKNADKKARNILRSVLKRNHRRSNHSSQESIVVVTGCFVDSTPNLKDEIPGDYLMLVNQDKHNVIKKLNPLAPRQKPAAPHVAAPPKVRANLMIQNGCENFCSYCIVPYVRGKPQSVPPKEIICQARKLVEGGTREIILTGINLGAYGPKLIKVIQALSKIRGLTRLRLSSIEPQYVTHSLIREIKNNPKVCQHLHLPMQSGDDRILKSMRRQYTARQFIDLCKNAKKQIPELSITTDIIVGFPGEDDSAFNNTLTASREIGFSRIHVFSFSPRPNTRAATLPGQIDAKIIEKRRQMLNKLRTELMEKFAARYHGKLVAVLAEEYHPKEKELEGLTSNYLRVKFKGNKKLVGKVAKVKAS